jgi:hypothetical protein
MKPKNLLFILFAFLSLGVYSQTMTDSLVTYLNFDGGDAVDFSPAQVPYGFVKDSLGDYEFVEGHNGGLCVHPMPGPRHNPAYLRSYDSFLDILSPAGATLAMWVALPDSTIRKNTPFFSSNTKMIMVNYNTKTAIRFTCFQGDFANDLSGFNETDTLMYGDVWEHAAMTFEPKLGGDVDSTTIKVYTHGKFIKSATVASSRVLPTATDTILIGSKSLLRSHQSDAALHGKFDEVVMYNRALSIEEIGYLMDDTLKAIYAPVAEIVSNELTITNGDNTPSVADNTDFGDVSYISGDGSVHTFTISNTGGSPLHLTGDPLVAISGGAGSYTLVTPPEDTIAAGGSSSFEIKFQPFLEGQKDATVTVACDAINAPYTFNITGNAIIPTGLQKDEIKEVNINSYRNIIKVANSSGKLLCIELFDITGRQVRTIENVDAEYEFTLNKEGLYIANVRSGQEVITVKKLIIW